MRILLVSDTHGDLEQLDALIKETGVDAVIHAGDFGFYDNDSVHRLQTRELRLLIQHSPVRKEYPVSKTTERAHLIEIIQRHRLLGTFSDYQEGKKTFSVPVYAVWGNHEDLVVVDLLRKNGKIPNLFLLDERNFYEIIPGLIIYGIGGNWLPGKKLFDQPVGGSGGKIWATLAQFGQLYEKVKNHQGSSLFVSHVSPGKEPLLVRLLTHFKPNLWISGHMGAPYPCLWNPFAVRDENDIFDWLSRDLSKIEMDSMSDEAKIAYDLIHKPLPPLENWYRKQWYLNLPDVGDGYAIANLDQGRIAMQTYSRGISLNL